MVLDVDWAGVPRVEADDNSEEQEQNHESVYGFLVVLQVVHPLIERHLESPYELGDQNLTILKLGLVAFEAM